MSTATGKQGADAIEIRGLIKLFGHTVALDGLDLRVAAGEVHGFLGPNGAGKSTTLRILLGLLRSDGGTATVLGLDPLRDAVSLHRRLAYVPGDVTLWPALTGGEVIDLLTRLHGNADDRRRDELIERFELDPAKRGKDYSKGNRQKVALVSALACNAELLLLDEPTSGLDPLMESVFRDCIQEERERGRTVLLSSHILSEVEALCDRVSIIRAGQRVDTGTLTQLRHLTQTTVDAETRLHPAGLDGHGGVSGLDLSPQDGSWRVHCAVQAPALGDVLQILAAAGVTAVTSRPPTLEELFLRHYASQPGEPGELGHDSIEADR